MRYLSEKSARFTAKECKNILQDRILDFEAMLAIGYSRFLGPGAVAIDIGAHAGYHYTKLKSIVGHEGRVIGFEPLPDFAEHIIFRHGGDAEIIQKALSSAPGRDIFLYMSQRPGESGFKERAYADARGPRELARLIHRVGPRGLAGVA